MLLAIMTRAVVSLEDFELRRLANYEASITIGALARA